MKRGITVPTPIQAQVIPLLLAGCNLIGISKTGSGKSLAFILPAIVKCLELKATNKERNPKKDPFVMVLSPVRELATQLQAELKDYGAGLQLCCLYGGKDKITQEMGFFRGIDIVVGTPGRINEFLENDDLGLGHVRYFILDEADQLLNMGFLDQIRDILETVHRHAQIGLFSATWPPSMHDIARTYLAKAVTVNVKNVEVEIDERFVFLDENEHRNTALRDIFRRKEEKDKVIVFVNTKLTCKELGDYFSEYKLNIIQGDLVQAEREKAMQEFKTGKKPILIATDVAARGIHIEGIELVVNYEAPDGVNAYTHRIGRTGRAGRSGIAITLLKSQDMHFAESLYDKKHSEALKAVLDRMEEKNGKRFSRKNNRRDEGRRN